MYRSVGNGIYGHKVKVVEHIADTWRVDVIKKYGGIYLDSDAIAVQPLSHRLRSYEAVLSIEPYSSSRPFPDIINDGVLVGKKNAQFLTLFQESMKDFRDNDWSFNCLRQPYKVKERYPELVLLDPHLQVIKVGTLCLYLQVIKVGNACVQFRIVFNCCCFKRNFFSAC